MNKEKVLKLINQLEKSISLLKSELLKTEQFSDVLVKDSFSENAKVSETLTNKRLMVKIENEEIDLGRYPFIKDSDPVIIKSLYVLDVVRNELKVKGLSASQISKIMPYFNKLKKESRQAIRNALDSNKKLVNIRRKSPKKIFYFIKKEGVKHYRDYAEKRKNPAS